MRNILFLYDSTQTFTSTVFEHLDAFARHSSHRVLFNCHQAKSSEFAVDLSRFDAVAIHYSIRLPFDQISPSAAKALAEFKGLKFLFIQDEYDHTHRTWHWIKTLGLQLVFTVVPESGIEQVYPAREFPDTRFISNLTGYVPEGLILSPEAKPPSQRRLMIGYRGRPLPIRYGQLGMEKVSIGRIVKAYCDAHAIENDIAWSETSRIYGAGWYDFMLLCRSMLGSESGSNVFDWDGTLVKCIDQFCKLNPEAGDDEIYEKFVRAEEIDGLMNQVSPRVFEAIAAKTVLVLFDGNYSGVVEGGKHFIPLKKDGSNLPEVVRLLQDDAYVDAMADRAYQDVIGSGKHSYKSFVRRVDDEIETSFRVLQQRNAGGTPVPPVFGLMDQPMAITTSPIRARPPQLPTDGFLKTIIGAQGSRDMAWRLTVYLGTRMPHAARVFLKPRLKRLLGKD